MNPTSAFTLVLTFFTQAAQYIKDAMESLEEDEEDDEDMA